MEYKKNIQQICITKSEFPSKRITTVLPFRKPGKYGEIPSGYRSVALTTCVCKLFEWLILDYNGTCT